MSVRTAVENMEQYCSQTNSPCRVDLTHSIRCSQYGGRIQTGGLSPQVEISGLDAMVVSRNALRNKELTQEMEVTLFHLVIRLNHHQVLNL